MMKEMGEGDEPARLPGRWRRWSGYALGMVVECLGVAAVSLAALGLMYLVKVLAT